MKKKKIRGRVICCLMLVILLVLGWLSFGSGFSGQKGHVYVVGLVSQTKPDAAIWRQVAQTARKQYGIKLEIRNFSDYTEPNKALKNGDIDLNAFQHYAFLHSWNKANGGGIAALGKTYIAPIRVYSRKYHKLADLPPHAVIIVPNDASNESRALYVLKNAGLIKLRAGKKLVSTTDIMQNPKNVVIKEVSAEQTGRVLSSADAAIVNNDYAGPAGLTDKQVIYQEPLNKDSQQWINIIAVRTADKNKQVYRDILRCYQTAAVKRLLHKYYGNKQLPAWDIGLK